MAKATRKADIKIRLTEPLRLQIERAAKATGVSMNAEMIARLERSFSQEKAFGSPRMQQVAHLMWAAFMTAGQRHADGRIPPGKDWVSDPGCYRYAMFGAVEAMMIGLDPEAFSADEINLFIESFKGRLMTHAMNEARRKAQKS